MHDKLSRVSLPERRSIDICKSHPVQQVYVSHNSVVGRALVKIIADLGKQSGERCVEVLTHLEYLFSCTMTCFLLRDDAER